MNFQIRLLIAIALCALIWVVNLRLNPPPVEPEDELAQVEAPEAATAAPVPTPAVEVQAPAQEDVPDSVTHQVATDILGLMLTNAAPLRGGLIEHAELLQEKFEGQPTGEDPLGIQDAKTLELTFPDADFQIPRKAVFRVVDASSTHLSIAYTSSNVEIIERFEVIEGYEARLRVQVKNLTSAPQRHSIGLRTRIGVSESRYDVRRGLCRTDDDLEYEDTSDVEEQAERYGGAIRWGGVDGKYFATLVVPEQPMQSCEIGLSEDGRFLYNVLGSGPVTVEPGQTHEHVFGLFIGAKELERLQDFSVVPVVGDGLEEAIDWGWFGVLSSFLGKLLLEMMRWFHGLVHSWGWSIVLLTVAVKIVTLPLTLKQMHSMRRMKELQPELVKLKEKYADDRMKQAQEMQALYARSGINPLAGCLPMLVQLPIWFALYAMLGAAVELLHVDFLWLPDLTQQDPFYILPLAIGGLMVLQSRMMPTSGDEMQAKMMRWLMPVMFVVFMLFVPSGLGVYIFVNIVLSLIQTAIQVGTSRTGEAKQSA